MALSDTLTRGGTLPLVEETTGQRVKRLRDELGWRQKDLAKAADVTVETVSNVERDRGTASGERPSVQPLLAALERERQRRAGESGPREDRILMEFLNRPDLEDLRIRRVGRHRKVRYMMVGIPDPDATPEQIREDLEDFHREQRKDDGPNG